jgi:hypothetical protein
MFTETTADWDKGSNGEFNWSRLSELFPPNEKVVLRDNLSFKDKRMTYKAYVEYLAKCIPGADTSKLPLYYGKGVVIVVVVFFFFLFIF